MPPASFIDKLGALTDVRPFETLTEETSFQKYDFFHQLHKQIADSYKQGSRGSLCSQDWDLLLNWTLSANITTSTASFLTSQGVEDIEFMARHYRRALASAIPEVYDPAKFLVS
jgi:hypothetical protein